VPRSRTDLPGVKSLAEAWGTPNLCPQVLLVEAQEGPSFKQQATIWP